MEVESASPGRSLGYSQQSTQRRAQAFDQDDATMRRIDFSRCSKATDVPSLPPSSSHAQISEVEFARADEEFRSRIGQMAAELDKMQPNLLAAKKVQDLSERVSEMNQSRKKLVAAFQEASAAFQACSDNRRARFLEAFRVVEAAIDATYKDLTRSVQFATGGQAVLTLTNPEVGPRRAFQGRSRFSAA